MKMLILTIDIFENDDLGDLHFPCYSEKSLNKYIA